MDGCFSQLIYYSNKANNLKRKSMYRYYIEEKYGYLGRGVKKRVLPYLVKYIFLLGEGEVQMGHRDK